MKCQGGFHRQESRRAPARAGRDFTDYRQRSVARADFLRLYQFIKSVNRQ